MPRESVDAPENLPKESRRQVALRQLQDEVSGRSLELLDQAKRALVAVPNTFMEGGAAIVR
jgi:hypothetical protein